MASPPQTPFLEDEYANNTACYGVRNTVSAIGEWILQDRAKQDFIHKEFNLLRRTTEQSNGYDNNWPVNILAFLPHLLLALVIMSATSHALHFFLRRLKQSLFVSQLIAGILIYLVVNKGRNVDSIDHYMLFQPKNRRLEQTWAAVGTFFNLFLMSLKVDASLAWCTGKKPFIIAIAGISIPMIVTFFMYFCLRDQLTDSRKAEYDIFMFLLATLCHSFFIVQAEVLSELGLLSSELGRLALSATIIQDFLYWCIIAVFNSVVQSQVGWDKVILNLVLFPTMVVIIIFVIRPYALWVVRNTPGGHVREVHVTVITLLLVIMALSSDIMGASYLIGPMLMGLALPSGPPLGTALIRRIDLVATELLLPLIFLVAGRDMEWAAARQDLRHGLWLGILMLIETVTKVATVAFAGACCGLSLKGGSLLGLIMNLKGIMEALVLIEFKAAKVINGATYTFLLLLILVVTSISSVLLSTFYKPLDEESNVCKNVSNLKSRAELRIITCFFDDKPVSSLLDFFEWLTKPVAQYCTCVYVIHLKELKARSKSNLICHLKGKEQIDRKDMDPVHDHFINFGQMEKNGGFTVIPFTSIVPQSNLHQDICSLIVERKVALAILPFPRKDSVADAEAHQSMRGLIPLVLHLAQCSVGIMVYNSLTRITPNLQDNQFRIGVFFMGGPDDREAVAIASRMASHPSIKLDVLHFSASSITGSQGDCLEDIYARQQTLDTETIGRLQRENSNNDSLAISEVIVNDAAEIMSAINSFRDNYDMMIVGRRRGHSSLLDDETLVQWTESRELGVIGDLLASPDFKTPANILVVQHHGSS